MWLWRRRWATAAPHPSREECIAKAVQLAGVLNLHEARDDVSGAAGDNSALVRQLAAEEQRLTLLKRNRAVTKGWESRAPAFVAASKSSLTAL